MDAGGAMRLAQSDLTAERLANLVQGLRREQLLEMAIASRTVARMDAADRVADTCIALAVRR